MDQSILAKYIAGQCSEAERRVVEAWKEASPDHAAEIARLQRLWEASDGPSDYVPDTDSAWEKLEERIETDSQKIVRPLWPRLLRVAAVAAILVAAGWFLFDKTQPSGSEEWAVYESGDSVKTVTLADGSVVTLNRDSRLEVSPDFGEERTVRLEGGAFFDVAKNPEKPFRVDSDPVQVQVLGTRFELQRDVDLGDSSAVLLYVEEGLVAFSKENDSVHVAKNQAAAYSDNINTIKKIPSPDPNFFAWRTGKLSFEDQPLTYILDMLDRNYHMPLFAPQDLFQCRITAQFNNNSKEEILAVLGAAFNGEWLKEEVGWRLIGGTCE
ncbi:MAG: FecR domain-containing protein [Bacteroidia bacterium]